MNEETKIGTKIATLLASFLVVAPIVAGVSTLEAFVLRDFWAWFFMPLGLPAVGLAHAWGLALTLTCALRGFETKKDTREDLGFAALVLKPLFFYSIMWLLGAIAHILM